jgi:RNA polymerase sigma factor (sigma-70 family)
VLVGGRMSTEPHSRRPVDPERSAAAILEFLVRERGNRLLRLARRVAGRDHAEDAVQMACLGFLRSYDLAASYDGIEGAFRYLAAATANSAAKLLRSDRRRLAALPPADPVDETGGPIGSVPSRTPDPLEMALSYERATKARAALADLPSECRVIVVARAAGYEPREIQQSMGLTERQYRKRVEKANRHLAERHPDS